jgi:hypothetical protein
MGNTWIRGQGDFFDVQGTGRKPSGSAPVTTWETPQISSWWVAFWTPCHHPLFKRRCSTRT